MQEARLNARITREYLIKIEMVLVCMGVEFFVDIINNKYPRHLLFSIPKE
jgi:hypothetical protein